MNLKLRAELNYPDKMRTSQAPKHARPFSDLAGTVRGGLQGETGLKGEDTWEEGQGWYPDEEHHVNDTETGHFFRESDNNLTRLGML